MKQSPIETNTIVHINEATKQLFTREIKAASAFAKQGNHTVALAIIQDIATYAWANFTSFYASYELEHILFNISKKEIKPVRVPTTKSNQHKRKILHVASELYEIGGHTPLMLKWMKRDTTSEHQIFVTRQSRQKTPVHTFQNHNIGLDSIVWAADRKESPVEVANILLKHACEYDMVVLHIHPDDIIPVLAFSCQKPVPVFFMNHADHCFWLGVSVIDGIIQLRKNTVALDNERRQLSGIPHFVIPIPVDLPDTQTVDKQKVLEKYALGNEHTFRLLTTSSYYKFIPFLDYNYFETIIPVLDKHPNVQLILVGVDKHSELAVQYKHPRIHFMGVMPPSELREIESVIDLYVETMPVSSFTAQLQVLLSKKPVHFMYNPPDLFKLFEQDNIYTHTKEEWQRVLSELLSNSETFHAYSERLQQKIGGAYTLETWFKALNKFYEYADNQPNTNPSRFVSDRSYTDGRNEIFLYGIGNRVKYTFPMYEDSSRWVWFQRILQYFKLQLKLGKMRDFALYFGYQYTYDEFKNWLSNKKIKHSKSA